MESIFAGHWIVAESLDVQETSVGIVADLPQLREILQPLSDAKVAGVVNRRLGTERALEHRACGKGADHEHIYWG